MLTLHVAIYYVCLQICVLVNKCDSSLYLLPPATVVAHVTAHMTNDHSDWPEKANELFEFLKELNTQLGDLMQAKTLQEFDLGKEYHFILYTIFYTYIFTRFLFLLSLKV